MEEIALETVFVLMGETGEYEQRSASIYGIFKTREAAERAVPELAERSSREYEAADKFRKEVKAAAIANAFPSVSILDDPDGARAYYAEYKRVESSFGGAPSVLFSPALYDIFEVPIGGLVNVEVGGDKPFPLRKE